MLRRARDTSLIHVLNRSADTDIRHRLRAEARLAARGVLSSVFHRAAAAGEHDSQLARRHQHALQADQPLDQRPALLEQRAAQVRRLKILNGYLLDLFIRTRTQAPTEIILDVDATDENVLADIQVDGQLRKVMIQTNKNGFLYVLDRTNCKLIAAHPFVKVNWATQIDTEADLDMGGLKMPKGSYSIWTLPAEKEWTLIINKQIGQFHLDYNARQDFGRVKMNLKTLDAPTETFTIKLTQDSANKGTLALLWEKTQASEPFTIVR